jgi:EAL domain-containing protein (putative c-di-GMP-specific phosphodiesterase class I)
MRSGLINGEFVLEYQPRFDALSRRVNSVEALVRWQHPRRGRIPPADFISVAEKSGLIVALGEWVLRTACEAVTKWPAIGISVNVSPVQFRAGNLTELVIDILSATGLDPARLELELTEGVLVEDAELARANLTELKAVGVRLAIDDFGTGYSSLSYLRTFPFDVIKIDRQFVADIDNAGGGRAIVQAILGLGKALGLTVTAEGVETDEQLMMLTMDACEEVQGYLLARPLAAEKVSELLSIPTVTGPPLAPCMQVQTVSLDDTSA